MNLYNRIEKENEYWLVDQVKVEGVSEHDYLEEFNSLLSSWRQQQIGYMSLLMDASYESWLLGAGFRKVSTIVEYSRALDEIVQDGQGITVETLADSGIADSDFGEFYERCRSGTANKNKLFTIEQVLESLENELGPKWRSSCFIFWKSGEPIGLSIPVIEQGTVDEGRLFYFGVVPEWRGKGYGTALHRSSLKVLRDIGATTYVGSTDEANQHMIRIFERNGCQLRDRKGIYRIDR